MKDFEKVSNISETVVVPPHCSRVEFHVKHDLFQFLNFVLDFSFQFCHLRARGKSQKMECLIIMITLGKRDKQKILFG